MHNFFGGSIHQMLSFFNDTKSVSISELEEIIKTMKEESK